MKNDASGIMFWIMGLMYGGTPDLMDTIIHYLNTH